MVLIQLKKSDQNLFIYESKTTILVKDLANEMVNLYNFCLRIKRLISGNQ